MPTRRFHRLATAALLAPLLLLGGCVHRYVNVPLERVDPSAGYRGDLLRAPGTSDEILLLLTFSGGGTRAAALAYGVLEELARTEVEIGGQRRRLLDEVDAISSVSGGSFTAAYYALFGERIFEDFEEKFLKHNVQTDLLLRTLLYGPRLIAPDFGRSDLAADYYDSKLFEGKTFEDLRSGRVPVLINATDMPVGARLGFLQEQFDVLCSDLSPFPVAQAVAASAAVPVVLSPVVLRNYAGRCGYQMPAWMQEALDERDTSTRRFHVARLQGTYLDARRRPFVHLVDGAAADSLGIRGLLEPIFIGRGFWQQIRASEQRVRHVVFIVVNAETTPAETSTFWQLTPGIAQILDAVSGSQIHLYNFETLELLRQSFDGWSAEQPLRPGVPPTQFHLVQVEFAALRNDRERRYLNSLPTSLRLSDGAVDRLRGAAGTILGASREFQHLLEELR